VQERAVAEAAGLGFFGKNTCLIRPKGGSFFFLCTLITDLELEITELTAKRWDCGACTLCLEACPTGALTEPYRLDASRCISSLTIENRGPIPVELRPGLGDWVFGCDICQEVCPYNKANDFTPAEDSPAVLPEQIPISELLSCRSEERFRALFQGTTLTRPGREGLVRNAAIVAGNLRASALIPELTSCLEEDASPLVRSHAAWALGQFKDPQAIRILEHAALREPDQTVLREIRQALS
jgi:epoxyqueuosine reductase